MITGTWKGKINKKKVEIKLIQSGDSIKGTSYYYESTDNYRKYSIKGYFDAGTSRAIWWDDQLLEERSGRFGLKSPGKTPLLSSADFNCPGSGVMLLEGESVEKLSNRLVGDLDLQKTEETIFPDDWDYVISNYTIGANDPWIIDSIEQIQYIISAQPEPEAELVSTKIIEPQEQVAVMVARPDLNPPKALTIEQKFTTRETKLTKTIEVRSDSIILHFYDNAEIDGDSISLFLNHRLVFQHIRLNGQPYIVKIDLRELQETNELVMVAENLGAIPPNTSYMIAYADGERHSAQLASSEKESAMIRIVKKKN